MCWPRLRLRRMIIKRTDEGVTTEGGEEASFYKVAVSPAVGKKPFLASATPRMWLGRASKLRSPGSGSAPTGFMGQPHSSDRQPIGVGQAFEEAVISPRFAPWVPSGAVCVKSPATAQSSPRSCIQSPEVFGFHEQHQAYCRPPDPPPSRRGTCRPRLWNVGLGALSDNRVPIRVLIRLP